MGKIERALERAKQMQDTGTFRAIKRQRREAEVPAAAEQDPLELWPDIHAVHLDHEAMAEHRITPALKHIPGAEMAYNMLRTRLVRRMRSNNWSSLIISSPDRGAGKTVTSINLAISIAREQGQNVYLVDLDLREPSVHRYLGVKPARGLTEYLDGKCDLGQVVAHAGIPRLFFVFNTVGHQHSAEMLTAQRMGEFVDDLLKRDPNALILYDSPPLLVADDVLAFSPRVDAVLLVVSEGETRREDLDRSIQSLGDTSVIGIVINKSHDVIQRSTYY